MQTVLRKVPWTLAALALLVTSMFLYLSNADLSRYERQIERAISSALGHKVDVDGLFGLHFGSLTGDPNFTDGLRIVIFVYAEPVAVNEIKLINTGRHPSLVRK